MSCKDFQHVLTSMMLDLLDDISKILLKTDEPIIVVDDYQWFIESFSLMAKQVSLCKACMILLDKDDIQEAYLIVRSQFNNLLWIEYLINDSDGSHLKEFNAQPFISQIFRDRQLIDMIPDLDESFRNKLDSLCNGSAKDKLNKRIADCNSKLCKLGVTDKKPKSILKLAKQDRELYGMYVTLYMEGSKFEHSDISTVARYRKKILPGVSNVEIFKFSLDNDDEKLWDKVFMFARMCLFRSYQTIKKKVLESETHLLTDTAYSKAAYNEEALKGIDLKFYSLQKMINETQNASDNAQNI